MIPLRTATVSVASSLLASIRYEADTELLQLEFRDGAQYEYGGVPRAIYDGLLVAPSKGTYFNRQIRGSFPYALLKRDG